MPLDTGIGGVTDDACARTWCGIFQQGRYYCWHKSNRIYGRASTLGDAAGDDIPVDQPIPDMSDWDDALPCNEESDNESDDEEVPDGIILDLYQEMQE